MFVPPLHPIAAAVHSVDFEVTCVDCQHSAGHIYSGNHYLDPRWLPRESYKKLRQNRNLSEPLRKIVSEENIGVIDVERGQAKITYLVHSGFSVETASHFFIFDYCPSLDRSQLLNGELLWNRENVYVFVSHNHGDHFDPAIFQWAQGNPAITYVLSSDVSYRGDRERIHFMPAYQQWTDRALSVHTFGSTDAGVSFLVKADGLSIFHAGDLNWWRWSGETQAEQDFADQFFKEEIDKIMGQQIDIAFFPVDRRLEENYALGAEYFAAKLRPRLLIPMHFARDFAATGEFARKVAGTPVTTVEITRKGQEILFAL